VSTGETAVVAVLRATKVIYMDGVETDRTVRAVSRVGAMLPAHCTAVGKVSLSFLSPTEIEHLYPENELPAITPRTLRTRDALFGELKGVKERGYAVENEECDLDVKSVAAPVRDFSKKVIAAVGVVAPANRLGDDRLDKGGVAAKVQEAAMALSLKLGYIQGPARK
jgi:IclR family transcriptional regulator, KDG regulon repressor